MLGYFRINRAVPFSSEKESSEREGGKVVSKSRNNITVIPRGRKWHD